MQMLHVVLAWIIHGNRVRSEFKEVRVSNYFIKSPDSFPVVSVTRMAGNYGCLDLQTVSQSDWKVNETRLFGSFQWKISARNGTCE